MEKLIAMMMLAVLVVGCSNSNKGTLNPVTADSELVKDAKVVLQSQLEKKFKKGTKAENLTVVYEKDSICIIDFDNIYTFASGRVQSQDFEFVYYAMGHKLGFFIDLSDELSMIEQAKKETDELELSLSPQERNHLAGWETTLKYSVMFRDTQEYFNSDEFNAEIQKEYEDAINSK